MYMTPLNNLLSMPFPPLPPISEVFDGQLFQSFVKDKVLMKNEDALKYDKGLLHRLISLASDDCAHGAPTHQSLHPHAKKGSHAPSSVYSTL